MDLIKERWYRLLDYSDEERQIAKDFIIEAVRSNVRMKAEDVVGDVFDELENIQFKGEDIITIGFKIQTIGNDIITAIGAAKRKIENEKILNQNQNKGDLNHGEK
jgi:hypothetical protein